MKLNEFIGRYLLNTFAYEGSEMLPHVKWSGGHTQNKNIWKDDRKKGHTMEMRRQHHISWIVSVNQVPYSAILPNVGDWCKTTETDTHKQTHTFTENDAKNAFACLCLLTLFSFPMIFREYQHFHTVFSFISSSSSSLDFICSLLLLLLFHPRNKIVYVVIFFRSVLYCYLYTYFF